MVTGLLDTSIVVDLLRKYSASEDWLSQQKQLGISRVVWLEILQGVRNGDEQQKAVRLLKDFELVELTNNDFEWATRQLLRYQLSHNVGAFDCLIAAPSHRLNLPLYTRNLKHFRPMLGDLAEQPY